MTAVSVHAPPASLDPLKLAQPVQPAPSVAFQDASGARHSLSDFRGRTVLLNLWATWCAPCVKELPALAALQKALPPDKFVVVPVDVGREGGGAAFLKAHGAGSLPVYTDTNAAMFRTFGAYGLPLTVLIDKEGRIIARAEGPADWSAPDSVAWMRKMAGR